MQKNLWQKCIFIAKNTFLPKQLNICLRLVALELCTQSVVAYAVVDDNDLSVLDHLDGLGLSSSIGNAVSRVFHNQHDVGNVERIAGFGLPASLLNWIIQWLALARRVRRSSVSASSI